jgi:hypothetical protein
MNKLREHRAAAELAKRLTVIHTEVPCVLDQPDVLRAAIDQVRLNELFDQLAFGQLLRQRVLRV